MRRWVLGAALLVTAAAGTMWSVVSAQDATRDGEAQEEDVLRDAPRIERQLRVFGENDARIGVSIRDVENGAAAGARVEDVRKESPAAKAGVQEGDVITEFDGERVRSARQLSRLVSETPAGRTVSMKIQRDGKPIEAKVTPEGGTAFGMFEHPDIRMEGMPHFRFDGPPMRFDVPNREWSPEGQRRGPSQMRLGVGVQGLTPQLAEYFGAKDGVLVTTVRDGSPAAAAGLKAGDVITGVDGRDVRSPSQLADAVREGDALELKISYVRDRKTADVRVKVPPRERPGRPGRPA